MHAGVLCRSLFSPVRRSRKIGNLLFLQRERMRMHEYAEKIASIGAAANPTFMTLGITPVSWGGGQAVLKMKASDKMHNGIEFLQGGFHVILGNDRVHPRHERRRDLRRRKDHPERKTDRLCRSGSQTRQCRRRSSLEDLDLLSDHPVLNVMTVSYSLTPKYNDYGGTWQLNWKL